MASKPKMDDKLERIQLKIDILFPGLYLVVINDRNLNLHLIGSALFIIGFGFFNHPIFLCFAP